MRAVVPTAPGELSLNFSWLPTFIGANGPLKRELEKELSHQIVGKPWNEETFDFAHELVLEYLEKKFKIEGLRELLDGLKYIPDGT